MHTFYYSMLLAAKGPPRLPPSRSWLADRQAKDAQSSQCEPHTPNTGPAVLAASKGPRYRNNHGTDFDISEIASPEIPAGTCGFPGPPKHPKQWPICPAFCV